MRSVPPRGIAGGSQPEGLSDSSRWSKRSADHRNEASSSPAPWRGATVSCHPSRVENHSRLSSGGLRYASTTGYYLTAFQAENSLPTFSHGFGSAWVHPPPRGGTDLIAKREHYFSSVIKYASFSLNETSRTKGAAVMRTRSVLMARPLFCSASARTCSRLKSDGEPSFR